MKRLLATWWVARPARDRRLLLALVLGVGVAVGAWWLPTAMQARARLQPALVQLRGQALVQDAQVDEIVRLRALPPVAASTTDLRALVQRRIDASGLGHGPVSVERVDGQHVKLIFGNVAIADWLAWADDMQAQHLRFSAVRIEAQAAAGKVSVTATLERPGR